MAKEHLEFNTAEDVDDLIADVHDLNLRLDRLRNDFLEGKDTDGVIKRSLDRLNQKRTTLLVALRDALEFIEGDE